jgi:hypothetical protein
VIIARDVRVDAVVAMDARTTVSPERAAMESVSAAISLPEKVSHPHNRNVTKPPVQTAVRAIHVMSQGIRKMPRPENPDLRASLVSQGNHVPRGKLLPSLAVPSRQRRLLVRLLKHPPIMKAVIVGEAAADVAEAAAAKMKATRSSKGQYPRLPAIKPWPSSYPGQQRHLSLQVLPRHFRWW